MSLDQAAAPEGLSVVSAALPDAGSNDARYEGFSSPDAPEPDNVPTTQEDEPVVEGEAEGEDQPEGEVDPWDGYEDYEHDGKTYKVPTDLKENLMLKADHTRRLQELAETKKQFNAKEQELATKFQHTEDEFKAWTALANVSEQIKPFETVNWNAEYQKILSDPERYDDFIKWQDKLNNFQAAHLQFQQLKEQQQGLVNFTKQAEQTRIESAKQATAERLSATLAYAQKDIKGWTPDLDNKITQFAMSEGGYDAETLKNGMTPQNYKILHLAYLGHQSQIRQQTAKPNPLPKPLTPTETVTAKAGVPTRFDLEKSSMDDYAKNWAARQRKR